jgi:hypothetical protein
VSRLKIRYTLADRYTLALWLSGPWAGSEEHLEACDEIAGAFQIDQVEILRVPPSPERPGGACLIDPPKTANLAQAFEAEISEAAARELRRLLPGTPTPAVLGRAKVKLLRALRAALPSTEATPLPS